MVVFTAAIAGSTYGRHGTTIETRLTVIDKRPTADPAAFPRSLGIAPNAATLLAWVIAGVPPRLPEKPRTRIREFVDGERAASDFGEDREEACAGRGLQDKVRRRDRGGGSGAEA
jgi:hypothetical protein